MHPELTVDKYMVDGQPDWLVVDFDISCSRCGYNLYMLTTPRCPECGLDFDWLDVLDSAKHRSRFLFEHNWRARPIYSFVRTFFSSLRPFRFWRQVSIHERPMVGPLLFLFVLAVPTFFLTLHGVAYLIHLCIELATYLSLVPSWPFGDPYVWIADPTFDGDWEAVGIAWMCAAGILAGATIMLLSLRQTLGRCRVRTVQVFRVCAYAAMPAAVTTALTALLFFTVALILEYLGISFDPDPVITVIMIVLVYWMVPAVPLGLYLWVGLSRYLHLPRALLLGMVAAGVSLLATITIGAVVAILL